MVERPAPFLHAAKLQPPTPSRLWRGRFWPGPVIRLMPCRAGELRLTHMQDLTVSNGEDSREVTILGRCRARG